MLLWFLWKSRTAFKTICVSIGTPALIVLTIFGAGIGYDNYRVTGNAFTLPYQLHDRQYVVASMFTMAPLAPEPAYRHPVMRQFYAVWNAGQRTYARDKPGLALLIKLYLFDAFFFPFWALMIPILLCPYDLATPEERVTVILMVVAVLMVVPLIASQPHYVAAFAGVVYLRFLHSLTRIWSWRRWGQPVGRVLAILLVVVMLGELCNNLYGIVRNGGGLSGRDPYSRGIAIRTSGMGAAHHSMTQELEQQAGRQLVLVRYAPDHDPQNEWVYNRADIDDSQIVWAREMGPEQDRPLLDFFHDRL